MATSQEIAAFVSRLSPEERAAFNSLPYDRQQAIVEQVYGRAPNQQQVQQPSGEQQVANTAANAAGMYAGNAAYDAITGAGSSTASTTGTVATPTVVGVNKVPAGGGGGTPMFDVGAPSYAGYLGAARDVYNLYGDLKGDKLRDEEKATRAQQQIALAVADVYTGGLAGMAEGYLRKNPTTRKWLEKLDKLDRKTNPLTLAINKWGTSDKWKTEGDRLKKLEEQGVTLPQTDTDPRALQRGRPKKQVIAEEKAKQDAGVYSNVGFAETRDKNLLRPEDIWGYAAFYEKFGNDWLNKFSEEQRRNIAYLALKKGAVDEHHGTIDIDWDKVGEIDVSALEQAPKYVPASDAPTKTSDQPTSNQKSAYNLIVQSGPSSKDMQKAYAAEKRRNDMNMLFGLVADAGQPKSTSQQTDQALNSILQSR